MRKNNYLLIISMMILLVSLPAYSAILVISANGTYATKSSLAGAATAADTAGKTVVVTSPLSAVQSNISSTSLHAWPANRVLKIVNGGSVANTTKFAFATGAVLLKETPAAPFVGTGAVVGLEQALLAGSAVAFSTTSQSQWYQYACWGDSLTYGAGGTSYPAQMGALVGNRYVYNGGVSGNTSTQIKTRMLADTARLGHFAVIWAGRNNFTSPTTVKADIAAMVAALPSPKRFLVLSVINTTYSANEWSGGSDYNTIVQLNADLAAAYPNNYLDIRAYLVSQYNSGIPQDVTDHGHDVVPTSLTSTAPHLNTAGYLLVAQQVSAWVAAHDPGIDMLAFDSGDIVSTLASPPPIGSATPAPGNFSSLYTSGLAGFGQPAPLFGVDVGSTYNTARFYDPSASGGSTRVIIRTATGQLSNVPMLILQNAAGSTMGQINPNGTVALSATSSGTQALYVGGTVGFLNYGHVIGATADTQDTTAHLTIKISHNTVKGLVLKGKSGASGNVMEWQDYNGVAQGSVLSTGEVELYGAGAGIILKTPDGTKRYRVSVNDAGAVVTALVP